MTRDEAMALIRQLAGLDHTTLLRALDAVLDQHATTRRILADRAVGRVSERGLGHMIGTHSTIGRFEDELCAAFNVWPDTDEPPTSWRDQVPPPDRKIEVTRKLWGAVMAVLDGHASEDERYTVRHTLAVLAWDAWAADLDDPALLKRYLQELLPEDDEDDEDDES